MLHLDIGSHGDHSTKLFGGHKHCYDGQWWLISCYFNCCITWIPKISTYTTGYFSTLHFLTLFSSLSRAAHGWGKAKKPPLLKICHTYPATMKLGTVIPYPNKIQKIYESSDTPLEFCWHKHFSLEISKFGHIKKYRYRLHFDTSFLILVTFFESVKVVLIKMITILMMSAKNGCSRPS